MKYIPLSIDRIEEILHLWNREIGDEFPLRKELLQQNSFDDQNVFIDGSYIALRDEEKVAGFIITKRWQEEIAVSMNEKVGWIQVLLVDSDFRERGIGTSLLKKAEESLRKNGIERVHLGRDPWHYFPGIPDQYHSVKTWFKNKGYEYGWNEFDLIWNDAQASSKPATDDLSYSLLQQDEKDQLIDFLHRCFPGRWEYEAIQYFNKGGTGREFVVLKKNDKIIGFCRINDQHSLFIAQNVYWSPLFKDALGGIGPLGIDANERKQGYGLAIVEAGIHFLQERYIHRIVIDWTGLLDFYGKLGFKPWKSYAQYSKSL